MNSTVTERIADYYRDSKRQAIEALAEVLCSAYKDATGQYPDDYTREKIYEAVS